MTLDELRKFKPQIQALAREYKIDPDSIRVFGSVARGDNTISSDIDLLIKPLKGCSIFDISAFHEDTGAILHCEVDVVSERAVLPAMQPAIFGDAVHL